MSQIQGNFVDSQNIVIVNGLPHFSFKGNTYLEKVKNRLPLHLVFEMEDCCCIPEETTEECDKEKSHRPPLNSELFDEKYDIDPFPSLRKGKKVIKKPSGKNMKKNKVKQNGYDDKQHHIDVNLPSLWAYELDWEQATDCCSETSSYFGYVDSGYTSSDFDDDDSLYEWNNGNHTGIGWN